MMATAMARCTTVVTARIHCGCTGPRISRELVCTPMMMPTEFTREEQAVLLRGEGVDLLEQQYVLVRYAT